MDANTKDVLYLLIPALGTGFGVWVAYKVTQLRTKVDTVAEDVLRVEKATNSHTDLLVAAKETAAHAEGKQEERVEQRERDKDEQSVRDERAP